MLVRKSSDWYYYSYSVYLTMWAVFPLLLLLSCQCYQAGTMMHKIPVSGTADIDEDKLLEYIDRQVAKEFNKANKDKDYIGCYHDDQNRLLKHKMKNLQDNSIENCRKHCKGFKYIGLQYHSYCLCGNTLDPINYPKKPEEDCHMPCKGNTRQICGGTWRNSIYYQKAKTNAVLPKTENDYVGCYQDYGNRLLKHRGQILKDNSIENCRKHCTGFKFIGLQARTWCFCGNTLDPIHYPKKPERDCKMPCIGNTQQMCGGAGRNSIYYQNGDYVGCYLDDNKRLLKHNGETLQNNSLESCRKHCKGFKYLGLQYHNQCFCGNTLDPDRYSSKPESECQMTCTGNPQQKCGGHYRNSIYHGDYVGCYLDDGKRLLKHKVEKIQHNSLESCRKHCKGFKYLGLQYRNQCFCGNTLDHEKYPLKPERECKMTCTGNHRQTCGDSWRNSIYHV